MKYLFKIILFVILFCNIITYDFDTKEDIIQRIAFYKNELKRLSNSTIEFEKESKKCKMNLNIKKGNPIFEIHSEDLICLHQNFPFKNEILKQVSFSYKNITQKSIDSETLQTIVFSFQLLYYHHLNTTDMISRLESQFLDYTPSFHKLSKFQRRYFETLPKEIVSIYTFDRMEEKTLKELGINLQKPFIIKKVYEAVVHTFRESNIIEHIDPWISDYNLFSFYMTVATTRSFNLETKIFNFIQGKSEIDVLNDHFVKYKYTICLIPILDVCSEQVAVQRPFDKQPTSIKLTYTSSSLRIETEMDLREKQTFIFRNELNVDNMRLFLKYGYVPFNNQHNYETLRFNFALDAFKGKINHCAAINCFDGEVVKASKKQKQKVEVTKRLYFAKLSKDLQQSLKLVMFIYDQASNHYMLQKKNSPEMANVFTEEELTYIIRSDKLNLNTLDVEIQSLQTYYKMLKEKLSQYPIQVDKATQKIFELHTVIGSMQNLFQNYMFYKHVKNSILIYTYYANQMYIVWSHIDMVITKLMALENLSLKETLSVLKK